MPVLLPLASFGIAAAGSALQYTAGLQQAQSAAQFQNQRYSQIGEIARSNYFQQIGQTSVGLQQERAATVEQAQQSSIEALRERATANVTLGERGVSGVSVNTLLNDFDRVNATNQSNLQTNLMWKQQQANEYLKSARANAQSQINGALPQPITPPSFLGTLLQIGTSGLTSYDKYQQLDRKGPYAPV